MLRAFHFGRRGAHLAKLHFLIYVMGAFLVYTGIKMAFSRDNDVDPAQNPLVKFASRHMRLTHKALGGKFLIRHQGRLYAMPMLLVLIMIESTDVVFAAVSIPAILANCKDPFIVYTSNAFALLGLRALYFAMAGIMKLFHYLHYGLPFIHLREAEHAPVNNSLALIAPIVNRPFIRQCACCGGRFYSCE